MSIEADAVVAVLETRLASLIRDRGKKRVLKDFLRTSVKIVINIEIGLCAGGAGINVPRLRPILFEAYNCHRTCMD